eukprot:scpid69298/ scgid19452/ 
MEILSLDLVSNGGDKSSASLEKTVQFLRQIGPGGWPLLHSLWEKTSPSTGPKEFSATANTIPTQFYVDDVDDLHCHWVAKIAHESDRYVHVTLGFSPHASQAEVASCFDSLEAAGAMNWGTKMLFPYLNHGLLSNELIKRGNAKGGQTLAEGLSHVYSTAQTRLAEQRDAANAPGESTDRFTVSCLDETDAPVIDKHWICGGSERTLAYIANNIRNLPPGFTCGIYDTAVPESSPASHENTGGADQGRSTVAVPAATQHDLVAWGMVTSYGGIGLLQTLAAYQRRGFSQLVIRRLTAALEQHSLPAYSCIEVDNEVSRRCFEKAGFEAERDFTVVWLHYWPEGSGPIRYM